MESSCWEYIKRSSHHQHPAHFKIENFVLPLFSKRSIWWLDSPSLTPIFQFLSAMLGQSGHNVVIVLQAKALEKGKHVPPLVRLPYNIRVGGLLRILCPRVLCFSLSLQSMRPHLSYSFDYGCNHSAYIWRKYMGHESCCIPLSLDLWVINHTTIGPLPQIHHKLLR